MATKQRQLFPEEQQYADFVRDCILPPSGSFDSTQGKVENKKKKGFTQKEKLAHYTAVAKGEKPVKKGSKFSKKEQESYARGQRDARNESNCMYAYSQASPQQRYEYAERKKEERALRALFKDFLD